MSKRLYKASKAQKKLGPMRLDRMVRPIAKPMLKKFGFQELHLFEHWQEIVGTDLSSDCVPLKYARGTARQPGGTLLMRVSGHRALEVQHSLPQIIDRINRFLGGAAVNRIRLVQGPVDQESRHRPHRLQPLTPHQKQAVIDQTKDIENDGLQRAMQRFGERVRQKQGAE